MVFLPGIRHLPISRKYFFESGISIQDLPLGIPNPPRGKIFHQMTGTNVPSKMSFLPGYKRLLKVGLNFWDMKMGSLPKIEIVGIVSVKQMLLCPNFARWPCMLLTRKILGTGTLPDLKILNVLGRQPASKTIP